MKMGMQVGLLLGIAVISAYGLEPDDQRAKTTLLFTVANKNPLYSYLIHEDDNDRFFENQQVILKSSTIRRRAGLRLRKTPAEVEAELIGVDVSRVSNSDFIVIIVEGRSKDFAADYANALADEYLKFRDEDRARHQEAELLRLVRDINRLSAELKNADERVLTYTNSFNTANDPQGWQLQRLQHDRDRVLNLHNELLEELLKVDVMDRSEIAASIFEYASIGFKPAPREKPEVIPPIRTGP